MELGASGLAGLSVPRVVEKELRQDQETVTIQDLSMVVSSALVLNQMFEHVLTQVFILALMIRSHISITQ